MNSRTGWLIFLFLRLFSCVSGFQSFQSQIPNGANVIHPCDLGKGRAARKWPTVGHMNDTYTPAKNVFGEDWLVSGRNWKAICNMDSDNDGLTNGEELGDPNCIWEFGQRPEYSETRGHPGFCEPDRKQCLPGPKPILWQCRFTGRRVPRSDRPPGSTPVGPPPIGNKHPQSHRADGTFQSRSPFARPGSPLFRPPSPRVTIARPSPSAPSQRQFQPQPQPRFRPQRLPSIQHQQHPTFPSRSPPRFQPPTFGSPVIPSPSMSAVHSSSLSRMAGMSVFGPGRGPLGTAAFAQHQGGFLPPGHLTGGHRSSFSGGIGGTGTGTSSAFASGGTPMSGGFGPIRPSPFSGPGIPIPFPSSEPARATGFLRPFPGPLGMPGFEGRVSSAGSGAGSSSSSMGAFYMSRPTGPGF